MADSLRIRMDGKFAHRKDAIEGVAKTFDRNKTGAVLKACEFATRMIDGMRQPSILARALEHPDMTPELAEVLSMPEAELEICRETNIRV